MESLYTFTIFFVLLGVLAVPYWIRVAKHRRSAEEKIRGERGTALVPVTLHPHIDVEACIGCGSCVKVCPESVLGIVGGRAAIVNGLKCVGHALCAEVCPVGAIVIGFGTPRHGEEIPWYDGDYQTNIPGLFIVGELGGIGLIKNAVTQAVRAVEAIGASLKKVPLHDVDVVIVGAGPAGLTAALAAKERNLRYVVLEQDSIGGTIFHYPRQKLVLTSPMILPMYGKLKFNEVSKEDLLKVWQEIVGKYSLRVESHRKVEMVERTNSGFLVKSGSSEWKTASVVLAMGRRGSPRKLGVPGEDLPKISYKLIEAESYQRCHVLVVGGGDSAVEAAVALARQKGNTVTLSYRREAFVRLKEKNEKNINELVRSKKIRAVFQSQVDRIEERVAILKEDSGAVQQLENDFVFIFAGGELPLQMLKSVGVRLRTSESAPSATT
jgi:putative YpdA family bacillithiol system oxidoreductase